MSLLDGLGAYEILQNGVAVVRRAAINFTGGVAVVDDPATKQTRITIVGGGGGGASDSDAVANLSTVVGATVTQALNTVWDAVAQRATTSALNAVSASLTALSTVVDSKAAQTALDALSSTVSSLADALAGKAPTDAEYIVKSLTTSLTTERTLEGDGTYTLVDYATPTKAIVKLASPPVSAASLAALKAPTYLVQTASADLDNERVVTGQAPLSVDYGTAGQAIVKGSTATSVAEGWYPATHFTLVSNATSTSAGAADSQKLLRLNTSGVVDATCLPFVAANSATTDIVGSGATNGALNTLSRGGHTHNHGNIAATQSSGTYHAPATATDYGFMTPAHVTSLTGKVSGPASSVANQVPKFSDTTGKVVAASGVSIDGANAITGPTALTVSGPVTANSVSGLTMSLGGSDLAGLLAAKAAGPASSVVNQLAAFGDTTGKVLAARGVSIDGANNVSGVATIAASAVTLGGSDLAGLLALKANVDFDIATWNSPAKTLALSDRNKLILCQYTAGSPVLTIPRDSTLNLPVGFTCQVIGDVSGVSAEWQITFVSEVMTGTFGIPARYANPYSSPTITPVSILVQMYQIVTLIKIGADKWFLTGHYVP